MQAGPGGADGVVNGSVFSQATNAVRYSGLNRRTSIASPEVVVRDA